VWSTGSENTLFLIRKVRFQLQANLSRFMEIIEKVNMRESFKTSQTVCIFALQYDTALNIIAEDWLYRDTGDLFVRRIDSSYRSKTEYIVIHITTSNQQVREAVKS